MSAFPHLPLFTDAFIADTVHLNAQETGAYLMLMMVAWRSPGCQIADDDDKLCRFARMDRRTWLRIKPSVMGFWTLSDGFWSQKRLSKEREYVSKRAEVNRENGKQGGRPKSLPDNDIQNPAGSSRVSETKAPIPSPILSEDTSLRSVDARPKKQRAKPKTPISEDTQPTERQLQDAYDEGLALPQIRTEWRGFRDHHLKHGTLFSDWPAAWRSWLRNPIRTRSTARASPVSRGSTADLWAADAIEGNAEIQGGYDGQRPYDDGAGQWDRPGRSADGRPYRDAPQSAGNDPRQLPTLRLVGSL